MLPDTKLDIAFIIDGSGSVRDAERPGDPSYWGLQLEFVASIIKLLDVSENGSHVGLVKFGNDATLHFKLDRFYDKHKAVESVMQTDYNEIGENTNIAAGLTLVRQQVFTVFGGSGDRVEVPNLVILLADGPSTILPAQTIPEADMVKQDGAVIIVIGITNQVNQRELQDIATSPNFVFYSANFLNLGRSKQHVMFQILLHYKYNGRGIQRKL